MKKKIVKYEKGKDGSYLHNCFMERRKDEPSEHLFTNQNGTISAFLNGYAIIPIERYARLIEMASPCDGRLQPVTFSIKDIKNAYDDLYGKFMRCKD